MSPTSDISLKDFIEACLKKWPWFATSLAGFLILAFLYVKTRQPVYERTEEILISDTESSSPLDGLSSAFSAFGFGGGNTSVYNELIALNSPAVMYEVANRLHLDMNYSARGPWHRVTLYGATLPVEVKLLDLNAEQSGGLKLDLRPGSKATLRDFYLYTPEGKEKYKETVEVTAFGKPVKTPLGLVLVTPNPGYKGEPIAETMEIKITRDALQSTVESYQRQINGDLVDEDADVIGITIKDVCVPRAVDILNELIVVYNENYVADKNKVAVATSKFIDERLKLISAELGDVDTEIADFYTHTGVPDLEASTKIDMEAGVELDSRLLELHNRASMVRFMAEFLANKANDNAIIPANTGLDNPAVATQIAAYNDMLLQRNTLLANSSAANPLVADLTKQLEASRSAIKGAVDNELRAVDASLKNAERERSKTSGRLKSVPRQGLELLSSARQQKVKESLYIYLLQKREENQLSQKFTADNIRILTPPMGSLSPVKPRKMLIFGIAFILGLACPLGYIYLKKTTDTKVRSRRDLETTGIPFAGEIPQVGKKKKITINTNRRRKEEKPPLSVVAEGKRDIVNEAFRVIRSNLDFMGGKEKGAKTVMLTSFNPGSGKSFVSYNLALSFALKHKRVLLIDCDLRHGSSSMFAGMPKHGLTDLLTGASDDWQQLLVKSPANPQLFIMPVGKMPPNPAELLEDPRLEQIIAEARKDFDYIFLDCPPVNIVVDTQIVGRHADSTLFIARAGLLDRSALHELTEFYKEKRFNHMSLILNGTDSEHSRYYTYGNYQSFAD